MRLTRLAVAVCVTMAFASAASTAAEKYYVPLLMSDGATWDLYWMKLDGNGARVSGPRLVRNSAGFITSAAIVSQGNKVLYTDNGSLFGTPYQVYSTGVNPKNGKVVNGPTQLTTTTGYSMAGITISKDGRKFVYAGSNGGATNWDIFLKKFKPNGGVGPGTVTVAGAADYEERPMITDDAKSVYYNQEVAGFVAILRQGLSANGSPVGPATTALAIPGDDARFPRVDASGGWMSYYRSSDDNLWVTRLTPAGVATGTPVQVTFVPPGQYAIGGLTRNARIIVYTHYVPGAPGSWTLYSQKLDASGNPVGSPVVLVPASALGMYPWILTS